MSSFSGSDSFGAPISRVEMVTDDPVLSLLPRLLNKISTMKSLISDEEA